MLSRSFPGQWCKAVLKCMYGCQLYPSHIYLTLRFLTWVWRKIPAFMWLFAGKHMLGVLLPTPVQQGSKIGDLICIWRGKNIYSNQIKSNKWTRPHSLVNMIPQRCKTLILWAWSIWSELCWIGHCPGRVFCGALPVCDLVLLLDLKTAASGLLPL